MRKNIFLALVMFIATLMIFAVAASAEDTYALTVVNGTGGGTYAEKAQVTVVANDPPEGQVFVRWDTAYKYLYNVDFYQKELSFRMPDSNFKLTAVFAAPHEHAPCGSATCTDAAHPSHTAHNYLPLEDIDDLQIVDGDNYYHLANDIYPEESISIDSGETLYLCLHGNDIISSGFHAPVFSVSGTGKLILCDCAGAGVNDWGKLTHASSVYGGGVKLNGDEDSADDPVFEMYGGNITYNNPNASDSYQNNGAGVYADYGAAMTMYNGAITNNKTSQPGGGVCLYNSSTFTMYNGVISGNTAYRGGGIYSDSVKATITAVTIHGGTITDNTATYGGGMYIKRDYSNAAQDLIITGGDITENTASSSGGGIYLDYSQATMSDGAISGNELTYDYEDYGGGVYLYTSSRFNMSGGTIKENKADYGAGVYVSSGCVGFYVSGSAIVQDNKNSNVYLDSWDNADKCIQVTGPLTGSIGVTTEHTPTSTQPVRFLKPSGYTITESDLNAFTSDRTGTLFTVKNIDQENYGIFGYVQYKVNIAAMENGTVTASPASAAADKTITLTATPNTGYELAACTVTDASGNAVAVSADGTFTMPASDVTITASWTAINYTISWDTDGDGTVDDTTTVAYGETPVHADGSKAADAQYTYTFSGWSPAVVAVTGNATYKATFSSDTNSYTVTWVDEDGTTVLEKDENVPYGTTPTFDGAEPTKAATAQYTYTFAGWTPNVAEVIGNATYKATYTETVNEYTVKFVNEDGSELQSGEVAYGETPAYTGETPTKEADAQYTYTFSGWSPAVVAVTGEATYTATFSNGINTYTVTWVNESGALIDAESVAYGGNTTKAPAVPAKTGHSGKWNHDGKHIVRDTIIKPEYTADQYTISFNTAGGSAIAPITQKYGSAVTAPAAPAKDGWTFQGWDKEIPAAMPAENVTLTATWVPAVKVRSFSLSAPELWLHSTETHQLEVTEIDPEGAICEFTWVSSAPAVLSVNSSGLLTASAPGTAVLTVTEKWSGLTQTCTVHVVSSVTDIQFADATLQLIPGDTKQLTATVTCGDQTVTNKLVTFTSSDPTVATVDQNGVVTAISEGSTAITATAANGVSASCTVKVQLIGDANRDGVVDVYDVLIILQYSAGWNVTPDTNYADVNRDGTVGLSDALQILTDCMGKDLVSAVRALQSMMADLGLSSIEITVQPADQYATAGESAAFTVTVSGDNLKYQWYINRNDGADWKFIPGATSSTYTIENVSIADDGCRYYCAVTSADGMQAISNEAVLHVTPTVELPMTGDAAAPMVWLMLMAASLAGMLMLTACSRKKLTSNIS